MKNLTFILILSMFALATHAQNSAVTKASTAQTKGELDKAKQYIDEAIVHEKTKEKGKTWYTKGLVYESIAFSDNADYKALAPDALEQSLEAYQKTLSMEKESSVLHFQTTQRIETIWGNFLNQGADLYQKGDFAGALEAFSKTVMVKPKDTTGLIYAAITAQQDKKFDAAEKYYNQLKEVNYASPDMYKSLIYIQRAHHKDNDKALTYIKEARELYPEDKDLMTEEINVLIITERVEEATQKLTEAIEREPSNPNLHYNLAFLYDQVGETDKSYELYKKAVELKPDYFDAVFNLAVINFNQAAEKLKVANEMDLKTYQKEGQKYIDEANAKFEEAVPYFEKAHEINPNDTVVLENLELIYKRLKKFDKVEEVQGKIAALGGGAEQK